MPSALARRQQRDAGSPKKLRRSAALPADHPLGDIEYAVAALGCCRQDVYTMVRKCVIPPGVAIRLGNRVRFDKAKLKDWMARGGASFAKKAGTVQ